MPAVRLANPKSITIAEISQARLGPGRIHHCMRLIGQCERAIGLMCKRAESREAFGKRFSTMDGVLQHIATSRAEVEQARMLVATAAGRMDELGNADARTRQMLAICKALVPKVAQDIIVKMVILSRFACCPSR